MPKEREFLYFHLTALVVEDDLASREMLELLLSQFFERVESVASAREALEKVRQERIEILFSDIQMADMDGFSLAKALKECEDLFFVFVSGHTDTKTLLRAIESGVDAFLPKPVDLESLLQVLTLFRRYRKQKEEIHLLRQYKSIVDHYLLVSKTDINGIITYANEPFEKVSGFKRKELIGKPHNIVRHPDMRPEVFADMWRTILSKKSWSGVIKNRKKSGEPYYVHTIIEPIVDERGEIVEFIALRQDITDMIDAKRLIEDRLKERDSLVILMPVVGYRELQLVFEESDLALLMRRLQKRARRLLVTQGKCAGVGSYIVEESILAFVVEEYEEKIEDWLYVIVQKLISLPIVVKGIEHYPSLRAAFSVGDERALKEALLALDGKSDKLVIDARGLLARKSVEIKKNIEMLRIIERALKNDRVVSYFQPIVCNDTKEVIKYESLIRLIDDDGKVLSPFFFLDVAKKAGLYESLTLAVLENSFEVYGSKKVPISINFSASDILRESVRNKFFALLQYYRPKEEDITIELLEDDVIEFEGRVKEFIDFAIEWGVSIAIDDFGSGYSNFLRIIDLKGDLIKIDGGIIKNIQGDRVRQGIVESIVTFAKREGQKTVAEFVENEEIFSLLCQLGVDCSQGYYFSPPLPPERIG